MAGVSKFCPKIMMPFFIHNKQNIILCATEIFVENDKAKCFRSSTWFFFHHHGFLRSSDSVAAHARKNYNEENKYLFEKKMAV